MAKTFRVLLVAMAFALLAWTPVMGHELWIETAPNGTIESDHEVNICWGHSGKRSKGRSLESQSDKISTQMLQPGGKRVDLETVLKEDCFTATTRLTVPGFYLFGTELQTGITSRPMHSIPANTRIIMYGKTLTHLGGSESGSGENGNKADLKNSLGHDLELVLLTPPADLKPGRIVKAKLLFQGKPFCKKGVKVTLSTAGALPLIEDPRIQSHEWSTSGWPDPQYGEVAFQLIANGKYLLAVRYYDETSGTYSGDRNDSSRFSHLRKGDTFEKTMYIATFSFQVGNK